MKIQIQFPIGDWSEDGHGKCDYYLATTESTLEDVRMAHFNSPLILGFDIGSIFGYEERNIDPNVLSKIKSVIGDFDFNNGDEFTSEEMFQLWLDLLNFIDPTLNLVSSFDDYEPINFYGLDSQGRHLDTPGYGLL